MGRQQKRMGTLQAIWAPVLLGLIGVPLVFEMVAPNSFYGVRTSTSLSSSEIWYHSNFYAGIVAVLGGTVATLANLAIVRSPRIRDAQKWWYTLGTTVLAAMAMVVAALATS